jgi:hypothetical protein
MSVSVVLPYMFRSIFSTIFRGCSCCNTTSALWSSLQNISGHVAVLSVNIMFNHNQRKLWPFSTVEISHYNTAIMIIRKSWWVWFMPSDPTCLCCCRVYVPPAGFVVYCLLTCGVAAPTWITGLFHWPAVLLLVYCIGGRFEFTYSPNALFCCFFCMVLLIAVWFLWFHTLAYGSVCVQHMLMPGYNFLCTLCVLCALLWLVYQTVLRNSSHEYYILFHISHLGFVTYFLH